MAAGAWEPEMNPTLCIWIHYVYLVRGIELRNAINVL